MTANHTQKNLNTSFDLRVIYPGLENLMSINPCIKNKSFHSFKLPPCVGNMHSIFHNKLLFSWLQWLQPASCSYCLEMQNMPCFLSKLHVNVILFLLCSGGVCKNLFLYWHARGFVVVVDNKQLREKVVTIKLWWVNYKVLCFQTLW